MMIKKIIPILIFSLLSSATALATEGAYLRFDGGVTDTKNSNNIKYKAQNLYGVGIGYQINDLLKLDLNLQDRKFKSKQANKLSDFSGKTKAVMLNATFNLTDSEDQNIIPYVMAGIGHAQNKVDNKTTAGNSSATVSGKNNGTAWNVGAGVTLLLGNHVNFDFSYRYADLGKVEIKRTANNILETTSSNKLRANEFVAGIAYKF